MMATCSATMRSLFLFNVELLSNRILRCASLQKQSLISPFRATSQFSFLRLPRSSSPASHLLFYHTTSHRLFGLEEFRDSVPRQQREIEPVGRSWSVTELRRKSYDDLHKLWYVLYKERNMLLTEKQLSRRKSLNFPQPERILKVRKSMGAIKHVLGERKREHLLYLKETREVQRD